jgi:hypothetical protein
VGDDIEVVEKNQWSLFSVPAETGPDRSPPWFRFEDPVLDALASTNLPEETGGGNLLSRRIGRIDSQVGEEEVERLRFCLGPIDRT